MKGILNMELSQDTERRSLEMEIGTKECIKKDFLKVKESISGKMGHLMGGTFIKDYCMERVYGNQEKVILIKDNTTKTRNMGLVYINGRMEEYLQENS
jgi:hypothetical protein